MNIGIITFHHAKKSYGACLQALALSRICSRYGSTEIINYENKYEQKGVKDYNASFASKIKRTCIYLIRTIIYNSNENPYNEISNLDALYGCVSKPVYHRCEEMNDLSYDVIITGSDQVWNPDITGGIDKAFLLDFGNPKKRISYSASMGNYSLSENEKKIFAECLKKFSDISVREEYARNALECLTDKQIFVAADPTMLLTYDEWNNLFPELQQTALNSEKYILTFFVTRGFQTYSEKVQLYASELDLPIWNIQQHNKKFDGVSRIIQAPTIPQFLSLIHNASLIITNSFHGTAFSVYFHKPFVSLVNKGNASRVENLLSRLDLSDRIDLPPSALNAKINYSYTDEIMNQVRRESLSWLENAIGTEKKDA